MEWLGYTVGTVAHGWVLMNALILIAQLNDPLVMHGRAKITIKGRFFIPWIGVIGFWMWAIYG